MLKYRIVEDEDGFRVYHVKEPRLIETTIDTGTGKVTSKDVTKEVYRGYTPTVFDSHYKGNDEWWTDIDCGMQRWCGTKTSREIRAALKKCGFDRVTVNNLIRKCKGETTNDNQED